MIAIFACTADYDTFGKSDYRVFNDIAFIEQDGSPAIYTNEHRVEVTMIAPADSIETWDSATIENIGVSSMATLHLVDGKFEEFPSDSIALDSLAAEISYSKDNLHKGDKIRIPASHCVYLMVVSESGKPALWQIIFTIPGVEPASSSSIKSSSSANDTESAQSSSSANNTDSAQSSSSAKSSETVKSSSSTQESSKENSSSSASEVREESSSSEEIINTDPECDANANAPQIISMQVAGVKALIDNEAKTISVNELPFRANLNELEITSLELSNGASIENFEQGAKYDLEFGKELTVKSNSCKVSNYSLNVGYQLPGSDFNTWNSNDPQPDSIWANANTVLTTTKKYTKGSMIGAEIKTGEVLSKIASGSLYSAEFNPKEVGTLAMASSSKWPDGNELIDFGKKFAARPTYVEFKLSYNGAGDSCDAYVLLENRTGDKNVNRSSSDKNTLVASAWYRSTKGDNTGRHNPDVVSVSEADANGMRTIRLKFKYGTPLEGSAIEKSSTFEMSLKSTDSKAIKNGLVQGSGSEHVTHIRVVLASSADGNHYKGKKDATLIVDEMRLIY